VYQFRPETETMLIRRPSDIPSSEITPESVYLNRRQFMRSAAAGSAAVLIPGTFAAACEKAEAGSGDLAQEQPNTWEQITTYNNFYEFGTRKSDPARNAHTLRPRPWSVAIEGHCAKPGVYDLEDILGPVTLEDRVYRHRCVEAWSMVIPWRGFELRQLLDRVEPTSSAKYVEFFTLLDPVQMPNQRSNDLDWPYVEGLRMDEAMHPLTILATGLYGRDLPNPNGAPLRLHVPWKYGFKSIKSIVKIRLVENEPKNTWQIQAAHEYGFFANVNPEVDHPRWSQAWEARIPALTKSTPTILFNGYGEQVAHLYAGMDLRKYY
jgi:sulfoxide reductase catalytic subunit YedY